MKVSKRTYEEIEKKSECTYFVCSNPVINPEAWGDFVKKSVKFTSTDGREMYLHSSGDLIAEARADGGSYRFYAKWEMNQKSLEYLIQK